MAKERLFELVAQGLSNGAIASRLHLSEKTIRNSVSTIFTKLGVRNRAELVAALHRER